MTQAPPMIDLDALYDTVVGEEAPATQTQIAPRGVMPYGPAPQSVPPTSGPGIDLDALYDSVVGPEEPAAQPQTTYSGFDGTAPVQAVGIPGINDDTGQPFTPEETAQRAEIAATRQREEKAANDDDWLTKTAKATYSALLTGVNTGEAGLRAKVVPATVYVVARSKLGLNHEQAVKMASTHSEALEPQITKALASDEEQRKLGLSREALGPLTQEAVGLAELPGTLIDPEQLAALYATMEMGRGAMASPVGVSGRMAVGQALGPRAAVAAQGYGSTAAAMGGLGAYQAMRQTPGDPNAVLAGAGEGAIKGALLHGAFQAVGAAGRPTRAAVPAVARRAAEPLPEPPEAEPLKPTESRPAEEPVGVDPTNRPGATVPAQPPEQAPAAPPVTTAPKPYSEFTYAELKTESEARGLSKTGGKSGMIAALQASDTARAAETTAAPPAVEPPAEPAPKAAPTDYGTLTYKQLREELGTRQLPRTGSRAAMVEALKASDAAKAPEAPKVAGEAVGEATPGPADPQGAAGHLTGAASPAAPITPGMKVTYKGVEWTVKRAASEGVMLGLERDTAGGIESRMARRDAVKPIGARGFALLGPAEPKADTTPEVKFSDAESEARWQTARKGLDKPTFVDKARVLLEEEKKLWTRGALPELPRTKEFGEARDASHAIKRAASVGSDAALREIETVVKPLTGKAYDLFTRKVVLDDLTKTEGTLPFKMTPESAAAELSKVDAALAKAPDVARAVETRRAAWDRTKKTYLESMEAIGINLAEKVSREDYFRHQVLDYANAKSKGLGLRGKGAPVTNRGFLKRREGSSLDINANYVEAEFEVMSQMLADAETAKGLGRIKKTYDISGKLKAEAKAAGVEDWKSLIPETHTEYTLRPGRTMFQTYTVPENIAADALVKGAEVLEIPVAKIKKALAMGSDFPPIVVPHEVAAQLERLSEPTPAQTMGGNLVRGSLRIWKRVALLGPRGVIKYSIRNATEVDKVLADNPAALKRIPQAVDDLLMLYSRDPKMPQSVREWADRGGASLVRINDLGDLRAMEQFKSLMDNRSKTLAGKILGAPGRVWRGYWDNVGLANDFRESILRYATYMEYLEQMKGSSEGKPVNFGRSTRGEVMGIKDLKDRAYRLSADMLGDYGDLSIRGQWLRDHVYPFWSFQELNFRGYQRGIRNLFDDGKTTTALGHRIAGDLLKKSPYLAWKLGKAALYLYGVRIATQVFNTTVFGDEERDLPAEIRRQTHIVLGRNEDGTVRYFNRVGTAGDVLEWFGADAIDEDLKDLVSGRRTLHEVATDWVKSPLNKAAGGISPMIKVPFELATGKTLYPDATKPRRLNTDNDRLQYITKQFGLEDVYKWAASKPQPKKTLGGELGKMAWYTVDPEQAAYYKILDEKERFRASKGLATGVDGTDGQRSNALRNLKLALRYGDEAAGVKYLVDYVKWGGTPKSMRASIESMDPLYGLNNRDRTEFLQRWLRAEDQEQLEAASKYYASVLKGDPEVMGRIAEKAGERLEAEDRQEVRRQGPLTQLPQ